MQAQEVQVEPLRIAPLLTIEEAADVLRVKRNTIYELLGRGDIASMKIGSKRLVDGESVKQFIERSRQRMYEVDPATRQRVSAALRERAAKRAKLKKQEEGA